MAGRIVRAAIVGASTLLGKELAEELDQGKSLVWDVTLLDAPEAAGLVTAAGDEAMVIKPVSADSFVNIDVVFFAGAAATTLEYWKVAEAAGVSIVDLSGALEGQQSVIVRTPFVVGGRAPDLATVAVVPAHAAAIMLALVNEKLMPVGVTRLVATVLQPASELGSAGVEEMHQQTVGLLSFKPLKKDVYDAQVAFNLLAAVGNLSKSDLGSISTKISNHLAAICGELDASKMAFQLVHAPVFHGYTTSVFVELNNDATKEALSHALRRGLLGLVEEPSPSNESAAGGSDVLFHLATGDLKQRNTFWLWMASDNVRFMARNAAACAMELVALRPAKNLN